MARSSGLGRSRALDGITGIISVRAAAITIKRPTTSKGDLDTTQTTITEHTERAWLAEPDEGTIQAVAGERVVGDLAGLVVADGGVDIQKDDRLVHGGVEYEVDTFVGVPNDGEADYWTVSLIRRH